MKREKTFKTSVILLGVVLAAIVGVLAFFIVYNAQWLIGDDAILINRTGWGIPFSIWDTIKIELGRFYPLAYMHENIALLFPGEMHSALHHYVINLSLFIMFVIMLIMLLWNTLKPKSAIDMLLLVAGVMICLSRFYSCYINVFAMTYLYITVLSIALVCLVLYYQNNKPILAYISLLCFLYSVFCGEVTFIVPLSFGCIALLFGYKQLTKQQKIFNYGLISIALIFLIIYFFGIYLQKEGDASYDPSHGTGVTFFENAWTIIKGQKFLFVAAAIWLYRQILLISKKDTYNIVYDSLLWTAGAMLVANMILRLNWHLYYYPAILVALPAVVYFTKKHFGNKIALVIVVLFAVLHSYKLPKTIKANQKYRTQNIEFVETITHHFNQGKKIVWYETDANGSEVFDVTLREWRRDALRTYVRFELKNRDWDYNQYDGLDCVLLYPKENDAFSPRPSLLTELPFIEVANIYMYEIPINTLHYEHPIQ